MDEKDDIGAALLEVAKSQGGIAVSGVSDGSVFLFTAELLQRLLDTALASPDKKILLQVKHSVKN